MYTFHGEKYSGLYFLFILFDDTFLDSNDCKLYVPIRKFHIILVMSMLALVGAAVIFLNKRW